MAHSCCKHCLDSTVTNEASDCTFLAPSFHLARSWNEGLRLLHCTERQTAQQEAPAGSSPMLLSVAICRITGS